MQQAHAQLFASVWNLQHVKRQRFWDGKQHSDQPYQNHLYCFPQGDPHPLHSAPRRHRMVAAHTNMCANTHYKAAFCRDPEDVFLCTGQCWGHTGWAPWSPLRPSGWTASAYIHIHRKASPQRSTKPKHNGQMQHLEEEKKQIIGLWSEQQQRTFITSKLLCASKWSVCNVTNPAGSHCLINLISLWLFIGIWRKQVFLICPQTFLWLPELQLKCQSCVWQRQ